MPSTATVAHLPRARWAARLPPARSICESSHPPKMSPFGLASAGIAITRIRGIPGGSLGEVFCDDSPATADAIIPPILHVGSFGKAGRGVVASELRRHISRCLVGVLASPIGGNHVRSRQAEPAPARPLCRGRRSDRCGRHSRNAAAGCGAVRPGLWGRLWIWLSGRLTGRWHVSRRPVLPVLLSLLRIRLPVLGLGLGLGRRLGLGWSWVPRRFWPRRLPWRRVWWGLPRRWFPWRRLRWGLSRRWRRAPLIARDLASSGPGSA